MWKLLIGTTIEVGMFIRKCRVWKLYNCKKKNKVIDDIVHRSVKCILDFNSVILITLCYTPNTVHREAASMKLQHPRDMWNFKSWCSTTSQAKICITYDHNWFNNTSKQRFITIQQNITNGYFGIDQNINI